jgi:gamma-glutamylcyclotransferase (GGCT)/AIG2-like uncharacterized protein YtfP
VSDRLFVYGTLRRGAAMHGLLEGRAVRLGEATAEGRLVDLGSFPGMVAAATPGERVRGELYAFAPEEREPLLDALDRYEGPRFERVARTVAAAEGAVRAWLYLYRGDARGVSVIPGGDYLSGGDPVAGARGFSPAARAARRG